MTDIFQEIDESVREERFLNLWKKYSLHVYGVIAVLLISAGGYIFYKHHKETRNAELALTYMTLIDEMHIAVTSGEVAAAAEHTDAFVKESGHDGYSALGILHEATFLSKHKNPEKALAVLEKLAEDRNAPEVLRTLGRIRWGYSLVSGEPSPEALQVLLKEMRPLIGKDAPWRLAALELTGYAAFHLQDFAGARQAFQEMLNIAETHHRNLPAMRARIMLDALESPARETTPPVSQNRVA